MAKNLEELQNVATLENIFSRHTGKKLRFNDDANGEQPLLFNRFEGFNDFYNSDIVKAHLRFTEPNDEGHEFDVVIKLPTGINFHKHFSKVFPAFTREIIMYTYAREAFPEFKDFMPECYHGESTWSDDPFAGSWLMDHVNVPCVICCVCCCRKPDEGVLILEDLTKNGYELFNKMDILDVDRVKAAFIALAKFHGTWFRFFNDEDFSKTTDVFTPAQIKKYYDFRAKTGLKWMAGSIKKTFGSLCELMENRKEDPDLIARVKNYGKNKCINDFVRVYTVKSKYSTLIHGDFWSNNMMFSKSKEENGGFRVKLLDFQMMSVIAPFVDLLYFLYIGTDWEWRKKHEKECLRTYFDTLQPYLTAIESDFEDFYQEFSQVRQGGLWGGLGVMANVLSPRQVKFKKFTDMNKMNEKRHEEITGSDDHPALVEIRRRMMDIVYEFDQYGFWS